MGAKKHPFYRIIVTEKESKRDGRFIEIVGHYNPCHEPIELKLNQERVSYWIARGAKPTLTVSRLIKLAPKLAVPETKPDTKQATA